MSETKHTPGPWHIHTEPQPHGCPIVGNGRGLMLAMLSHSVNYPNQRDEANANARLIAAAPDLLEKAQVAMAACERMTEQYGDVAFGVDFVTLGNALRAAIAKATTGV